jgi:sodium-dependent dicarboxylate transporter 2/3/5
MSKKLLGMVIALSLAVISYFIMLYFFNDTQSKLIAVVVLLVTLWTNSALALGVTSLLPIVLFPLLDIGSVNQTVVNYSKSIIFLFLGGFMIAIAVEKIGLHKVIAHKLLSLFPKSNRGIIYALAVTSALLSAVLSNTTTALLLMPIALFLTDDRELKLRFVLAIAYGASIGGILTPIGTPPNLILMGFLDDNSLEKIAFFDWMLKTAPLVAIVLLVVPFVLSLKVSHIRVENSFERAEEMTREQKRLSYILISLVVFLFINSPIEPYYSGLGISDSIILLSFGLLMFFPEIGFISWEDTKKIPYEIIFLFGAGFSIAWAFGSTDLANEISAMLLNLTDLHYIVLLLIVATLVTFTTELTSNTALISIALPIIYSLSNSIGLDSSLFLMVATICASYAFMLPIATPPNAIAMSSGVVTIKDMAKFGFIFNIVAISLTTAVAVLLWAK